jgi:hypothetical protein
MDIVEIDGLIRIVRGQRVMLDRDLASLYGVPTRSINRAVRRNVIRFPDDFVLRLTPHEASNLKFQTGTSSWGGRRKLPQAFTEQGVAMLSSVLRSERAALVNIGIMRVFVRLRRVLGSNKDLAERMEKVEKRLGTHEAALGENAKAIRSVFEDIRRLIGPPKGPQRRIGFTERD